jgi:hypothetical protein
VAIIFDPDIELNSIQYAFPNWDSSQEFPEDGDVGGRRGSFSGADFWLRQGASTLAVFAGFGCRINSLLTIFPP